MKLTSLKYGLAAALCIAVTGGTVLADSSQLLDSAISGAAPQSAQSIKDYWTPERMQAAVPMEAPAVVMDAVTLKAASQVAPQVVGAAGVAYGWKPGQAPAVQKVKYFDQTEAQSLAAPQYFGSAPSNPKDGPYGPFSRQSMGANYLVYPRSVIGKLFFTLGASNFVCSGTVIGTGVVATAGHCNSNGAGTFATNRWFCPSYYNPTPTTGAAHPSRGCWSVFDSKTSSGWHTAKNPDHDYACLMTNITGDTVANRIGNVTGTAGRAWNWGDFPVTTFGYPQGAPFVGNTIQQTNSTVWYGWDASAGGQVSNVIGSDLTGGSSGGGWLLAWRAPGTEIADTDASNSTDPLGAGPFITGVNSHKRCVGNCNNPPSTTAGVFWQEMTSPPFLSSAAGDESEDIFAVCYANEL